MDEFQEKIKGLLTNSDALICQISHLRDITDVSIGNILDMGSCRVGLQMDEENPEVIFLEVGGSGIPNEFYIDVPGLLVSAGAASIRLLTWGCRLNNSTEQEMVRVVDHIACRLSNPLTGSVQARYGEAFVNMRNAYEKECEWEVEPGNKFDDLPEAIIWHTEEVGEQSAEEVEAAAKAGCDAVSASVVPWVVCARNAGCRIAVVIDFRSVYSEY